MGQPRHSFYQRALSQCCLPEQGQGWRSNFPFQPSPKGLNDGDSGLVCAECNCSLSMVWSGTFICVITFFFPTMRIAEELKRAGRNAAGAHFACWKTELGEPWTCFPRQIWAVINLELPRMSFVGCDVFWWGWLQCPGLVPGTGVVSNEPVTWYWM